MTGSDLGFYRARSKDKPIGIRAQYGIYAICTAISFATREQ